MNGKHPPATCEKDGERTKACACGEKITETIPKNEHKLTQHEAKEPTCTETGWKAYETCSRCDYTTYEELPMGHKYSTIVTPPSCLEGGYTTHTCIYCGDTYTDELTNPTGHTMGNWYKSKSITKDSDEGEMRRDCLNCDIHETKAIAIVKQGNFGAAATLSGVAKSTAKYKLFEDGTLKITGTGATYHCHWNGSKQPYIDYRNDIKRVIICEGITTISGANFAYLSNLETVEFPSTLTTIATNAFMDGFKYGITTITIPATVTSIGTYAFGNYSAQNATFTDVIFENPNIRIYRNSTDTDWIDTNFDKVIKGGKINSKLRLYSYGEDNNVKKYADAIGVTYINLEAFVSGTVDNVNYVFFNGKLELSAVDPTVEAVLPATMPWLSVISNKDVTELIIGEGIKEIPADYFRGYTALTKVKTPESLESVGSMAFATMEDCDVSLSVSIPEGIKTLGENIFNGRTNVTLAAFYNTVADDYEEEGVTLSLCKTFRLLLIGNSLSLDGADCSSGGTPSQLYNIIKAMLGENSYVEIGTLYSGAKSATWHATMAETGQAKYSFMVISDKTEGLWRVVSNAATTTDGLDYTEWDYVTIQPYASETGKGIGSMTSDNSGDCAEKDEKFLALSASLPFLLDFIETNKPGAKVYYYCTWPSVMDYSGLNIGAEDLANRIKWAKESMTYIGTETDKEFAGWIPAGTSIQNARTTYLGLLNYTDSDKKDVQQGLQRDNVHLSLHLGRYIAGLTIAEFLIPEEMRAENYTLPDIMESDIIGKLPAEYTTIAQMAVAATIESGKLTGTEQYYVTQIPGYNVDPTNKFASTVSATDFSNIKATSISELETKLTEIISGIAPADMKVDVAVGGTALADTFSATVTLTFGYMTKTVTVNGTVAK